MFYSSNILLTSFVQEYKKRFTYIRVTVATSFLYLKNVCEYKRNYNDFNGIENIDKYDFIT